MKQPVEVRLANGMVVRCLQKHEVPLVRLEIADYFAGGVQLRPGDTVFDVGANIGLFSLVAYERCAGDLRLHAFEPVPALFELLQANVERNTSHGAVQVHGFGLSDRPGSCPFTFYPRAPVLSTAYPDEAGDVPVILGTIENSILHLPEAPRALRLMRHLPALVRAAILKAALRRTLRGEPVTCEMRTLSQVMGEHGLDRIDLLKIDVERAELDVLRGIEDRDWSRIRQAVVEVHDIDGRLEAVRALLQEHGFSRISVAQPRTNAGSNIHVVSAL